MADETQTDATTSEATQTGTPEATDTNTSTTEATDAPPKADGEADPLDTATDDGIAAEPAKDGETETKAEGEGDADDKKDGDEAPSLIGAPEGDYELSLPEGMALDADALEKFTPTAKALNLSNEGLSKLAAEAYPVVEGQVQKAQVEAVVAQRKDWEAQSRTLISGGKAADGSTIAPDPAFGGDKHETVMAVAAKAIDRFGGDKLYPNAKFDQAKGEMVDGTFRDFLKATGLANHPAMVRTMYLAGKAISEDSDFERTGATPHSTLTREEKYYGSKT